MSLYYEYRTAIFVVALILPLAFGTWHFFAIGPKGAELAKLPQTVQRFGLWDRVFHILRALGFVGAALTGSWIASHTATPIGATVPHEVLGKVFAVASVLATILVFRHGLPRAYDLKWLRHFGGYLSSQPLKLRAAKFNAGQKVFIWLGVLLAIGLAVTGGLLEEAKGSAAWHGDLHVAHGLLAASAIALVIGHVYLSLVAVPGTWKVLFHGRVAIQWLTYHHPDDDSLQQSGTSADGHR